MSPILRRSPLLLIALLAASLACVGSCELDNPRRVVAGDYWLWRGELAYFYLEKGAYYDASGAGVIRGNVEEIGWTQEVIAVKRKPLPGEASSTWVVIDVRRGVVSGPYDATAWERLRAEAPSLESLRMRSANEAWEELGGG